MRGERGVAGSAQFAFDAAHIGYDRAHGKVRGDEAGELDDFVDRCGISDRNRTGAERMDLVVIPVAIGIAFG
jgi:hypothetical protein